ncbi:hypothetical protein [Sphingomonas paucimobilis]|uniref:hypothetical protein n=1 Tax=Sphingomonas paucimobilis TaxID=13689 RepID=UPI0028D863B5|nr:hypothetical protein [Sphingomonas paucimobilis]
MAGSTPPARLRPLARPLWLGQPGRLTGLSPVMAGGVLGVVLLLILIAWATQAPVVPLPDRLAPVAVTIVDHVRHGQPFYAAAIDALRENEQPLRPALVAVPLPALPETLAALPPEVGETLLILLGLGVVIAWARRWRPALDSRIAQSLALVLAVAGLYPLIAWPMSVVPESWAALLIALSLVQRRPQAMPTAVALGLVAMILTPVALLHALVMLALAWQSRARQEVIGWVIAIALFLLVLAAHAHALNAAVTAIDPAIGSVSAIPSPGELIAGIASAGALGFLPMILALPLGILAALGWAHWRLPVARRAGVTMAAYALAATLTGGAGFLTMLSPLLFLGVVFAPDALRDLVAALRDRRRITVKRVVR